MSMHAAPQAHKMVPLEQLAVEFGMRTTDVIDRIAQLESMGRLTGIMDERGKVRRCGNAPCVNMRCAWFICIQGRYSVGSWMCKCHAVDT